MLSTHNRGPVRTRHRRSILFALTILVMVALQWFSLKDKIRCIDPDKIPLDFVELRTTSEWRTGYVVLHHGAVLVSMPLNTPPASAERDAAAEEDESDAAGDATGGSGHVRPCTEEEEAIRLIMGRELDLAPLKAGLELALYVALLFWGFFGARRFRARVLGTGTGRSRACVAGALSWMVGWLIAAAPLVACGYGPPLFSNWMGPGAASWSSGYPGSWGSGLTVSYRHFIETAALWPMLFLDPAVSFVSRHFPTLGDTLLFLAAGLVFYGAVGGVLTVLRSLSPDGFGSDSSRQIPP